MVTAPPGEVSERKVQSGTTLSGSPIVVQASNHIGTLRGPPSSMHLEIRRHLAKRWFFANLPVIRRRAHFSRQTNSRIAITEIKLPHRHENRGFEQRTDRYLWRGQQEPPRPDAQQRLQRATLTSIRESRAGR